MSVMTDRTVAALCFAVFAFALIIGYVWGRWNGQRALDDVYTEGYGSGYDDGSREASMMWADRKAGRFDSAPPGPARPGERSPAGPGALAEMFAAPDEAFWEYESPGGEKVHLTAGLRIYPELRPERLGEEVMSLDTDERSSSAAHGVPGTVVNVPRPESHQNGLAHGVAGAAGPGHPAIGWVDQQLYLNAVTRARIEAREHAEMEDFHADVARVDDQIARWGDWARESLKPRWQVFSEMVST